MRLLKIRPSTIEIDRAYQRNLDESRCKAMASAIDPARIGVPVVSKRANNRYVALDGQHRIVALKIAEKDDAIYCEVHEGLSVTDEAALFLKLNGGRKAVNVFDRWRARLVANEPISHEITGILAELGLRISNAPGKNIVCAIAAVESVHLRRGNLKRTMSLLKRWADGVTPGAFEGELVRYVSAFLSEYPDASDSELLRRLAPLAPERVMNRIKRLQGAADDVPRQVAACAVFREIYNHRNRAKLSPPKYVQGRFESEHAA